MLTGLLIFTVGLVGFDLLALQFGADTRDGDDWNTRA